MACCVRVGTTLIGEPTGIYGSLWAISVQVQVCYRPSRLSKGYTLTWVDPVNATLSTSACRANFEPNAPFPVITLNTPGKFDNNM